MHAVGRLFPRGDRAPAIEPMSPSARCARLMRDEPGAGATGGLARAHRVTSGFYISQALELTPS